MIERIHSRRQLILIVVIAVIGGILMTSQIRFLHVQSLKSLPGRDQTVLVKVNQDIAHLPDPKLNQPSAGGDTLSQSGSVDVSQKGSSSDISTSNSSTNISVNSSNPNGCSVQSSGSVGNHNETTTNGTFTWNSNVSGDTSSSVSVHCD